MFFLRFSFFLLIICSSFFAFAENLPTYELIDLGLFGMNRSEGIAINEKGQVLGTCEEGDCQFIFLWDEINGLKLIDKPSGCQTLKLNNNSQISGVTYSNGIYKIFFWDSNLGFWQIESSTIRMEVVDFNDNGQILGKVGDQIFLWSHGDKTNLTALFIELMPGNWTWIHAASLNNHGHVAFNAYKPNIFENNDYGIKSFFLKDSSIKMIIPESWKTSEAILCIDDNGNMIINMSPQTVVKTGDRNYFFNPSKKNFTLCQGCDIIKNGHPLSRQCLPGKEKKDPSGKLYFTRGLEIRKLLKQEFPYHDVSNTAAISDQNSKGQVVGTIETMYPAYHAFLAKPNKKAN